MNLVDFDALWGHRRNVEGYGKEIEKFDKNLGVFWKSFGRMTFLFLPQITGMIPPIAAPTIPESNVPFLAYSKTMKEGGPLETRILFPLFGASVAD